MQRSSTTRTRRDSPSFVGTPAPARSANTGPLASLSWFTGLELVSAEARWFVEIVFESDRSPATRFQLDIYSEEWGFMFSHGGLASWIRVTDIRFVHGRDDHKLLRDTPPLREIGRLIRTLETRYDIHFPRETVAVRTNVPDAEPRIRKWATFL